MADAQSDPKLDWTAEGSGKAVQYTKTRRILSLEGCTHPWVRESDQIPWHESSGRPCRSKAEPSEGLSEAVDSLGRAGNGSGGGHGDHKCLRWAQGCSLFHERNLLVGQLGEVGHGANICIPCHAHDTKNLLRVGYLNVLKHNAVGDDRPPDHIATSGSSE